MRMQGASGQSFDLIKEFNLYGAGYWQLMRFFRANWLLMDDMFYIERDWP